MPDMTTDDTRQILAEIQALKAELKAEIADLRETVGRIDERTKAAPTWSGVVTLILGVNGSTVAAIGGTAAILLHFLH